MKLSCGILLSLLCLVWLSCKDEKSQVNAITASPQAVIAPAMLSTLDTNIVLSSVEKSNYRGTQLTSRLAKRILYAYFKRKGCYTEDNLPGFDQLTEVDNDKLCVTYDTLFMVDLNHNEYQDAIVKYWLTPPYANGHCWQPKKAIILDTNTGYTVKNEGFIPENYAIDSVVSENGQVFIYGFDYDCGNHEVLKYLRITMRYD